MSQAVQRRDPSNSDQDFYYDNSKNYGSQGDYEKDLEGGDPYGDGFDPSMDGGPQGDGYVEDQGNPMPEVAYTANDLRSYVSDLKQLLASTKDVQERSKISAEIKKIETDINNAVASGDPQVFASIMADLTHVEAEILGKPEGGDPANPEDPSASRVDLKEIKKEIEKAIRDIDGRANLTDDEKVELKAPLEKDLTEIKLAKDDPSKVDPDQIQTDLTEAKTNADQKDAYSPAIKSLAGKSEMSEEEIKLKAEAKGIDLSNPPLPPTKEMIDFFCDLNPDLNEALKTVETAVNERQKSIDDTLLIADSESKSNHGDTSSGENHDMSPWQKLFDLKYFQDDKSKAVVSAMQTVTKDLQSLFEALYPGKKVELPESNGVSGWQKTQKDFELAGLIKIGDTTVDLFFNTDGKLSCTTTPDSSAGFTIPDFWWDGEGDGAWNAPAAAAGVQSYDDKMSNYLQTDDSGNDF